MTHYADSNIRADSLSGARRSPLFARCRLNRPLCETMLRHCPLPDNPGRLSAVFESAHAKSIALKYPEDVRELSAKRVKAAGEQEPAAQSLWENSRGCASGAARCTDGRHWESGLRTPRSPWAAHAGGMQPRAGKRLLDKIAKNLGGKSPIVMKALHLRGV